MADAYFITPADREVLKQMAAWWRRRGNPRGGNYVPDEEASQAPEVYVAYVPTAGIAALSAGDYTTGTGTGTRLADDVPPSTVCDIYQVVRGDTVSLAPIARSEPIYNVYNTAVAGDQWVLVVREKFGSWQVIPPPSGGEEDCVSAVIDQTGAVGTWDGSDVISLPLEDTVGVINVVAIEYIGTTVTAPDGWTAVYNENDGTFGQWVGYRVVQAVGEDTTFTVSGGGFPTVQSSRHVALSNATIEDSASATGTSDTATAPSVTSAGAGRTLLVALFPSAETPSTPTGMATAGYGTAASGSVVRLWSETVGSGATGTRVSTLSGSATWHAVSMVLGVGDPVNGTDWSGNQIVCGKVVGIGTGPELIDFGST